jgi:alpha-tubulin suppressor-like RCC1 family protein
VADGVAGGGHTLLRMRDGSVYAVGKGRNGQLGRGEALESVAAYRLELVEVESVAPAGGMAVSALAAGSDHSMALMSRA